ncbi:MAG: hypothetical protein ACREVL_00495, partial [Solimonas sp.]
MAVAAFPKLTRKTASPRWLLGLASATVLLGACAMPPAATPEAAAPAAASGPAAQPGPLKIETGLLQ